MTDLEYADLFYGGRPFTRRTSGAGKGRRTNPRDRNDSIMKCDNCGAEDHFRADCPRQQQGQRSMFAAPVSSPQQQGPPADLLSTEEPTSCPATVQSYATTIPADMGVQGPHTDLGYFVQGWGQTRMNM